MSSMNLVPGNVLLTADGVVGTSGNPIRVFSIHIISGSTAGVVNLRNGTLVTDTIYLKHTGVASDGVTYNFAGGVRFPDGCYYDEDANVTSSLIVYTEEF